MLHYSGNTGAEVLQCNADNALQLQSCFIAAARTLLQILALTTLLQASEQAKQVLEEKVNGMVQEVSEIKRLLSGRSLTDSSHERQHDQVSCSHTLS